jgi:catechol 2,3-dioxygenase-like lactoylglutathione lyase family enzyme
VLTGVDHLVIAVRDLERAADNYRALGFTVVPGGRHPVGTHNALIAFPDESYLELIAFWEPNPAHRWWGPLQQGGGLVDFCLATDDLQADLRAFRAAGVPMDDPAPLSRVRPDGYELRWMLAIPREGFRGVAPFLIADTTPRTERVPRTHHHANGVTGLGTLVVAVHDPARVAGWYGTVLGRPPRPLIRDDLDAAGLAVAVGAHTLAFLAPRSAASPLAAWLAARGPAPWEATLKTTSAPRGPLDPARTEGARLALTEEERVP